MTADSVIDGEWDTQGWNQVFVCEGEPGEPERSEWESHLDNVKVLS